MRAPSRIGRSGSAWESGENSSGHFESLPMWDPSERARPSSGRRTRKQLVEFSLIEIELTPAPFQEGKAVGDAARDICRHQHELDIARAFSSPPLPHRSPKVTGWSVGVFRQGSGRSHAANPSAARRRPCQAACRSSPSRARSGFPAIACGRRETRRAPRRGSPS